MEGAVLAVGLPVAAVEAVHLELEGAPAVPGTHHPAVQPAREVQISQQGARSQNPKRVWSTRPYYKCSGMLVWTRSPCVDPTQSHLCGPTHLCKGTMMSKTMTKNSHSVTADKW